MQKALFAQVCSATGKGINQGFKVGDEWFATEALADAYCLATEGKSYLQLYNEVTTKEEHQDWIYYTEFDEDDIDSMNYYEDGSDIDFDAL